MPDQTFRPGGKSRSTSSQVRRIGVPDICARKGGEPIVSLTAYTAPIATVLDPLVDFLLVGDSLGMVLYGFESTLPVTLDMMISHGAAVVRGSERACIAVDMPFSSYEAGPAAAFASAARMLTETGCAAVKLEGGVAMAETIAFLVARGIPVLAHIGLTPQSANVFGGFRVQGREDARAQQIRDDAQVVADAGAFGVVIEGVPETLGREITEAIDIPTIGIGASPACDGQILVTEDMVGLFGDFTPKFVKRYADLNADITAAAQQYADDVRARTFPGPEHCFGDAAPADYLGSRVPELATVRTVRELRAAVAGMRLTGDRIGLIPTMGALHEAHMALVAEARRYADRVVVTILLNPTQFGPDEDFSSYPRREARDIETLHAHGVDLLFAPGLKEMYPDGFETIVNVPEISRGLCGDHRPGHFAGVATIVTKLLLQALPDIALFGEKDYQQLQLIRRLAHDLDVPVEIIGLPTVRETDGLAVSSRNAHLSAAGRAAAPQMFAALNMVADRLRDGEVADTACAAGHAMLAAAGFAPIEYLEVRAAETLAPADQAPGGTPLRVLAAAWLGETRLIDNIPIH